MASVIAKLPISPTIDTRDEIVTFNLTLDGNRVILSQHKPLNSRIDSDSVTRFLPVYAM